MVHRINAETALLREPKEGDSLELRDIRDGTMHKSVTGSRNLEIVMSKRFWDDGKVLVIDTKRNEYVTAKVNGTILINVSEVRAGRGQT